MGLLEGRRGSFLRVFAGVRFVFSIATKGEICDLGLVVMGLSRSV